MLAAFTVGLIFFRWAGAHGLADTALAARLVIALSVAAGVGAAWREARPRRQGAAVTMPAHDALRAKTVAIWVCLLALLLWPTLLARVFPAWPTQASFNTEYLLALPALLLLTPAYVRWAERRMPQPDDGYARLGQVLLGRRRWRWDEQRPLLLAWAVKLFFIPLMYTWLVMAVTALLGLEWRWSPTVVVAGLFAFGLGADLLIATAGYVFASRLLDNEVRSTDATWLGWMCCVLCYPPLLAVLHALRQQTDDVIWSDWLQPAEPLYWLWAALVTLTWLVYWVSTMAFGLRFSNLSWRGLVDTGPYRYTRHPAYLSKNLYWWLHTVPFVGVADARDLMRNLAGLVFVSTVYYLRAKTEERHLMAFPEYAAYAARIARDGGWARCRRRLRAARPA